LIDGLVCPILTHFCAQQYDKSWFECTYLTLNTWETQVHMFALYLARNVRATHVGDVHVVTWEAYSFG
jgi:hypothetical protein